MRAAGNSARDEIVLRVVTVNGVGGDLVHDRLQAVRRRHDQNRDTASLARNPGRRRAGRFRGLAPWRAARMVGRKLRPLITGLLIGILGFAVRDQLPRRRASSFAVVLLVLLGVALILAAFRVDAPMLSGGNPQTWNG